MDIAFSPFGETYGYSAVADVVLTGNAYIDTVADECDFTGWRTHLVVGDVCDHRIRSIASTELSSRY